MSPQSAKILWSLVSRLEAQQKLDRDRTQPFLPSPETGAFVPLQWPVAKVPA